METFYPGKNFKVILVGESNVGKSCIVNRMISNTFGPTKPTIGASFFSKDIVGPNTKKRDYFQIWDTAGQEIYKSMMSLYYRNAHIAIVVYSVSSRASYEKVSEWVSDVVMGTHRYNCGSQYDPSDEVIGVPVIVLIANKIDMRMIDTNNQNHNNQNYDAKSKSFDYQKQGSIDYVTYKEGVRLLRNLKRDYPGIIFHFYEASAKVESGTQQKDVFDLVLTSASEEFHKKPEIYENHSKRNSIKLDTDTTKDKSEDTTRSENNNNSCC